MTTGEEIADPLQLYLDDTRVANGRPWVMMNMISSVDGATAVGGKSTGLGDHDDRALFKAIRTIPDVILAGAGTVSAEDYGPVALDARRRALRSDAGRTEAPVLAIVSGRLNLDPESRVFSNSDFKPMVLTGTSANPTKLMMLGDAAEVVILDDLSPSALITHLGAAGVVLIEGGPTINGEFISAGLVDEINLTVSPKLVSGESWRIARGSAADPPLEMRLDRALAGDRALFLRYLRAEDD